MTPLGNLTWSIGFPWKSQTPAEIFLLGSNFNTPCSIISKAEISSRVGYFHLPILGEPGIGQIIWSFLPYLPHLPSVHTVSMRTSSWAPKNDLNNRRPLGILYNKQASAQMPNDRPTGSKISIMGAASIPGHSGTLCPAGKNDSPKLAIWFIIQGKYFFGFGGYGWCRSPGARRARRGRVRRDTREPLPTNDTATMQVEHVGLTWPKWLFITPMITFGLYISNLLSAPERRFLPTKNLAIGRATHIGRMGTVTEFMHNPVAAHRLCIWMG